MLLCQPSVALATEVLLFAAYFFFHNIAGLPLEDGGLLFLRSRVINRSVAVLIQLYIAKIYYFLSVIVRTSSGPLTRIKPLVGVAFLEAPHATPPPPTLFCASIPLLPIGFLQGLAQAVEPHEDI